MQEIRLNFRNVKAIIISKLKVKVPFQRICQEIRWQSTFTFIFSGKDNFNLCQDVRRGGCTYHKKKAGENDQDQDSGKSDLAVCTVNSVYVSVRELVTSCCRPQC